MRLVRNLIQNPLKPSHKLCLFFLMFFGPVFPKLINSNKLNRMLGKNQLKSKFKRSISARIRVKSILKLKIVIKGRT